MRRNSLTSNGRSRPTTPKDSLRSMVATRSLLSRGGRSRSNSASWTKYREHSPSVTSDSSYSSPDTPDQCLSPVELREELDRYETESKLLTSQEWLAPPSPRSQTRRMNAKEYNIERVKMLKRWAQVEGLMYGLHSSSLRDSDAQQPRELYAPGVIFSAPVHTSTSSEEMYVPYDDPNLTATPFGTVLSKFRKMVILKVYGEHVQCLPIYTHNGRGLDGKEFPREYVSIRDVADEHPAPDEGPHKGIRALRNDEFNGTFIKGRSVVKLTEIFSHRFEAPATIEGRLDLDSDSRRRLFDLVKRLIV
ncbi:hypothetical protein GGS26DRAFT_592702 [Hypomontagnella submonticulosa]|nr:hypothetical protein GGS26DRAFT_592702 [Hypomontagnella submonticulosa]